MEFNVFMDEQPTPGVLERIIRWYFVPGPKPWLPSASIMASGLFMIYGLLFLHWDAFLILFLYWAESIIIGVFVVLRLLFAPRESGSLVALLFFCFGFGTVTFMYGVIIAIFVGVIDYFGHVDKRTDLLLHAIASLFERHFGDALANLHAYAPWATIALLLIVINQGLDFGYQYLFHGEYRTVNPEELVGSTFERFLS